MILLHPQVREDSFKAHQELQLHIQLAKRPNRCYEPIHLHLAYRFELKKELARSERILQKLGNFAALVHQMIAQSLVTIIQQDAVSFLNCLKVPRKYSSVIQNSLLEKKMYSNDCNLMFLHPLLLEREREHFWSLLSNYHNKC